ncbi:MAG TPA: hypothetical protein PKW35_19675 [Nannocystaceae bacterium]|nr:hypothetical protein [Nannocystaceae bacterium]
MGVFAEFYDSHLQQPILLWVGAAIGLAAILARRDASPALRRYCLAFTAVSIVDAFLTGPAGVPGFGPLPGVLSYVLPVALIVTGDLRYFLFLEATRSGEYRSPPLAGWLRALAWSWIVPLLSRVVYAALPATDIRSSRALFLTYELLFLALALLVNLVVVPRRTDPRARLWGARVGWFVIAYYALWVIADLTIAAGHDLGYLVRTLANFVYYGGLLAVVCWAEPPRPAGASRP